MFQLLWTLNLVYELPYEEPLGFGRFCFVCIVVFLEEQPHVLNAGSDRRGFHVCNGGFLLRGAGLLGRGRWSFLSSGKRFLSCGERQPVRVIKMLLIRADRR